MMKSAKVEHLNWCEVEEHLKHGALAVLPTGAAAKEHGYHLPMNADFLQAEWLTKKAMALAYVLVWPTVSYGYYPAFVEYPGSVTLREDTYKQLIGDIACSILGGGAKKLLIINTGVSTVRALDELAAATAFSNRLFPFHSCFGEEYRKLKRKIGQQRMGGTHADEMETSLMLSVACDTVRMDMAVSSPNKTPMAKGPLRRHDQNSTNYSPSGVSGDPTMATKDKGDRIAEARVTDLKNLLASLTL